MTAVIHKVMDERIARFDRIFKEMTDHKDGTNLMLQYFERAATLESEKAKQDRKVTAFAFITELASMKQDAFEAYASVTKINVKAEDYAPSPNRV